MISLANSETLDNALTSVFNHKNIRVIAMDFKNDIKEINLRSPEFKFIWNMANLHDLNTIYSHLNKDSQKTSLAHITEDLLGMKICKYEQISNWERRPLTQSQMHYAAVDAYILIELYKTICDNLGKDFEEKIEKIEKIHTSPQKIVSRNEEEEKSPEKEDQKAVAPVVQKKTVLAEQSPETHRLLTSKFVLDVEPCDEYSFIVDDTMSELYKILKHHNFRVQVLEHDKEKELVLDQIKDGPWIIITRSVSQYKAYEGQRRIFFNFRHKMPPFDQFNGLMRQLKIPLQTEEDIMDRIQ